MTGHQIAVTLVLPGVFWAVFGVVYALLHRISMTAARRGRGARRSVR